MILIGIGSEMMLFINGARREELLSSHFVIIAVLLVFITLKSSSSFHAEKENGAFELLLVAPFTERSLVAGRLRAVLGYYGPVLSVLLGCGLIGFAWNQWDEGGPNDLRDSLLITTTSMCASFFSVPVCGLNFALRARTFLPALLATLGLAILAPIFFWHSFNGVLWMLAAQPGTAFIGLAPQIEIFRQELMWVFPFLVVVYHLLVSLLARRAVINLLVRREFNSPA